MVPLPRFLLPLTCLSFIGAAVCLALAALAMNVTPILWIVPAAFTLTSVFHGIFLLMANSVQASDALRLYSAINITASYVLCCLWTGVFAVCVAVTVLFKRDTVQDESTSKDMWSLVFLCIFGFLQDGIIILVAVVLRKERNLLRYKEKWRWRPGALSSSSQWSFGQQILETSSRN